MIFKLRNFESKNSGDATETSTWVDFISLLRLSFPFIYIIRCTPFKGARSLRIYSRGGFRGYVYPGIAMAVVCIYYRWRGQALRCLSFFLGAMRRPENQGIGADGYILPRLFCFHNLCRLRSAD